MKRASWMAVCAILITFFILAACSSKSDSPSSAKEITAYSVSGVAGTINESAKTINIILPFSADLTALTATFTTTGSNVKIGSVMQESGVTANNFINSLTYTITAADGTTAEYTVTVTLSSQKAITAYTINGIAGTIDESAKTIIVNMPLPYTYLNTTALAATFVHTGISIKAGGSEQVSGATANNFTMPVVYTVTAADGTTANYTVTITLSAEKAITSYSINGVAGMINESAKTISVTFPPHTNVTSLTATFVHTGISINAGGAKQVSGATANNFTTPLIYTVTAASGTTANYTVTVTVTPSSEKAITAYSINGIAGTINETAKVISVTLSDGTDYTSLVATFTTTGASIKAGATTQVSGATANDFTLPVTYTVTAEDSSTQAYAVNVIEHGKIISGMAFYAKSRRPYRIALQNGVAYIADGAIRIIDVSTPTVPAVLNAIYNPTPVDDCSYFYDMTNVSVFNNKMLVSDKVGGITQGWCTGNGNINIDDFGNIYTYDVSNPASPVRTSSLGIGTGDIILEDNIAYVSRKGDQPKLNVIDTSVQPQSSILGSVNIRAAGSLAKNGNFIFNEYDNVQNTIDVTSQTSPSVLYTGSGSLIFGESDGPRVTVYGNVLYIANGTNGLRVWDISNPASPSLVLTIPALSDISDIAVYNGYLYAADGTSGIRVFNISNPLNPVYTKTISTASHTAMLVAVSGGVGVAIYKEPSSIQAKYFFGVFLP